MAFSADVIRGAWDRQEGRCASCGKKLVWANRSKKRSQGAWQAHHIRPVSYGGTDGKRNCAILCINGRNCHWNVGHKRDYSRRVPMSEDTLPHLYRGSYDEWGKFARRLWQ